MSSEEIQADIDECIRLMPSEDVVPWLPEQLYAEDAAAALAYALRCRKTGKEQEAAWAARRAYEALDQFVVRREGLDMSNPGAEDRIRTHRLIQAELQRQSRDIQELLRVGTPMRIKIDALRRRAKEEAQYMFATA